MSLRAIGLTTAGAGKPPRAPRPGELARHPIIPMAGYLTVDHQLALVLRAAEIMGSPTEAQDWLRRPAQALGRRRPIDLLESAEGQRLLDAYLGDLEFRTGPECERGERPEGL